MGDEYEYIPIPFYIQGLTINDMTIEIECLKYWAYIANNS
jgi:hypothetical protein